MARFSYGMGTTNVDVKRGNVCFIGKMQFGHFLILIPVKCHMILAKRRRVGT